MVIIENRESPNHSSRYGDPITMIVMHATAGDLNSSLDWLCSAVSNVSAHYVIDKDGTIYRLVQEWEAAWHAGASTWYGRNATQVQRQSIGIELVNRNDGEDPYPNEQMIAAMELCRIIISKYGIRSLNVVRHLDIAPGRKTDPHVIATLTPANFPWEAWKAQLYTFRYYVDRYGANAFQDRKSDAIPSKYYAPSTIVQLDDITNGYGHDVSGIGFIPMGSLHIG
jgi:N-acetyl-anhydromuramyl-L-alanine amidase AmpD